MKNHVDLYMISSLPQQRNLLYIDVFEIANCRVKIISYTHLARLSIIQMWIIDETKVFNEDEIFFTPLITSQCCMIRDAFIDFYRSMSSTQVYHSSL